MPNKEENKSQLIVPLLFRFFTGLALALVLMLAGAIMTASGTLPASAVSVFPAVAGFAGALWCGRGAARMLRAHALLTGFVSGVCYFFTLFLLGAVFFLRWAPSDNTVSMLLSCLLGGLAGGLLALPRGKRRKKPTYDAIRRKRP